MLQSRQQLWAGILMGVVSWLGCGDPCQDLRKTICNCEPTIELRNQCQKQSETREKQAYAAGLDRKRAAQRCSQYLGRCTCEALAKQQLSECGISDPAHIQP